MSLDLWTTKWRILRAIREENKMMKRRRRWAGGKRTGPSPYMWLNVSGWLATVNGATAFEDLAVPGDWSGTAMETQATLVRIVLQLYAYHTAEAGVEHAENVALVVGNMSTNTTGYSIQNISDANEMPDFFSEFDDCLYFGRVEFPTTMFDVGLPVQYSQLPDPVINLRRPRKMETGDTVRLCVGGAYTPQFNEVPTVAYFGRILFRIR